MMSAPTRSSAGGRPDMAAAALEGQAKMAPNMDAIPTIDVVTLLGSGREAVILHRGERYRLRVTANDKLILTK